MIGCSSLALIPVTCGVEGTFLWFLHLFTVCCNQSTIQMIHALNPSQSHLHHLCGGISVSCKVIEVCWYLVGRDSVLKSLEFDRGDVIEVYIKTIKALRLVDPRGLLLEGVPKPQATDLAIREREQMPWHRVSHVQTWQRSWKLRSTPIREYLKKRKDTVRCIITASRHYCDENAPLRAFFVQSYC